MDLVSLILMCSLATSPATNSLVYQVAQTNDADPAYIDDWSDASVYRPNNLDQAAKMIAALLRAGHELRVGVLQLPARQTIQAYGVTSKDLVDACTNIAIGSDRLEQAQARFPDDQTKALAWYLTDDPQNTAGKRWARLVLHVEIIDLTSTQQNVEHPTASREYARPSMMIFSSHEDETEDTNHTPLSETLFPLAEQKTSERPMKWKPKPVATSKSTSTRKSETRSQPTTLKKPQPSVTDERLLTSDQIEKEQMGESK